MIQAALEASRTYDKGKDDFHVWIKPSDFIFNLMVKKRKQQFKARKLKKPILVKITIIEDYTHKSKNKQEG